MSSFAPSSRSLILSAYGSTSEYGRGGGDAAGSGVFAKTSSGTTTLHSGTYSDSDGYSYDVSATSITIYKKDGSVWKTVKPSDGSWDTIVTNLAQDMVKGTLKSGKAVPQAHTSYSMTTTTSAADPGPEFAEDPFYKKTWFPIAVVGGVLAIGILTYALWPSKT
jgi:hypothetical protein